MCGLFVMITTTYASLAHAEGSDACNPAYEEADALVRAGGDKLLDARDKLRICVRPVCKAWMVKECTKSLTEVEARIPSVVFSAKEASGAELVDVTVTSGDKTWASRLDGRSIEIGPGERSFVFVTADGRRATVKTIVKEGEKAQRVTAAFEPAKRDVVAPVVPKPAAPEPPPRAPDKPAPPPGEDRPSEGSNLRTIGLVAGGVGVIGLGVGTVFALKAMGSKSDANCNDAKQCDSGPLADARSAANVATIGFVAGAVLVAGGVVLVLVSPARGSSSARRIEAAPALAQHEAGLVLRGLW